MSEASPVVAENKVVSFHYVLSDGGDNVFDSSEGEEPMAYLHGANNIVPGLERQLAGRLAGESVTAIVPPEEGYGLAEGPGPQALERSLFPDDVELQVGMSFLAEGPNGEDLPLWITELKDDKVLVDSNHPLAGVELHFQVEILAVRDATEEEVAHGHPHGPGGHHH